MAGYRSSGKFFRIEKTAPIQRNLFSYCSMSARVNQIFNTTVYGGSANLVGAATVSSVTAKTLTVGVTAMALGVNGSLRRFNARQFTRERHGGVH
jgi:hypothetical protein